MSQGDEKQASLEDWVVRGLGLLFKIVAGFIGVLAAMIAIDAIAKPVFGDLDPVVCAFVAYVVLLKVYERIWKR